MRPSQALLLVVLATLLAGVCRAQGGWTAGRASFFGTDAWSIHNGACGLGYQFPNVGTGWDVTAISDASPEFVGSCGRCYEVRCRPSSFKDGYGQYIDRSNACRDPSQSVVVTVVDSCPCNYPDNAYSNKRWCCNDNGLFHMDMSVWAFEKLATSTSSLGVIGIEARRVPCSYLPSNPAPSISNPTPGQQPPHGAKAPDSSTKFVHRFDSAGAEQGAVKRLDDPSQAGSTPTVPFSSIIQGGFPGAGSPSGSSLTVDTGNGCTDTAPSDGTTCAQQKAWGACSANWLLKSNACRATCGRCSLQSGSPSASSSSSSSSSSASASASGSATSSAASSSPSSSSSGSSSCVDVQVPNEADCSKQKAWGKCSWDSLISKNYCAATCGRCSQQQEQQQQQQQQPQTTQAFSAPSSSYSSCVDVQVPNEADCSQQKAWGKCSWDSLISKKYCAATCGRCSQQQQPQTTQAVGGPSPSPSPSSSCVDVQVPNEADCSQQKAWGKCSWDSLISKNYCAATCGRCSSSPSSSSSQAQCSDNKAPDGYSCQQQKDWGKCGWDFMVKNSYCSKTCGRC